MIIASTLREKSEIDGLPQPAALLPYYYHRTSQSSRPHLVQVLCLFSEFWQFKLTLRRVRTTAPMLYVRLFHILISDLFFWKWSVETKRTLSVSCQFYPLIINFFKIVQRLSHPTGKHLVLFFMQGIILENSVTENTHLYSHPLLITGTVSRGG